MLATNMKDVRFQDVIEAIDENYHYTPTSFTNGIGDEQVLNEAGTNEGSCKIFAFARLHNLGKEQTLNCFGDYYRIDVLQSPQGESHANIRTFMRYGWAGIVFENEALTVKGRED